MSTTTEDYAAVDAKNYDDLTPEDLRIIHEAEQQSVDNAEKSFNETGKIHPAFWDYVRSSVTYGYVHHKALIQKKAEYRDLHEASGALRDASVAYVTELEEKVATLQAQLQESNDQ